MSNFVQRYGLKPIRFLCPWDSLGKKTEVGCYALLKEIFPTPESKLPLLSPVFVVGFFATCATWWAQMVKNLPANARDPRDLGSIPGSGRCPEAGKGNPHQYSGLENSMDRGAWWATDHGIMESRTQLSD